MIKKPKKTIGGIPVQSQEEYIAEKAKKEADQKAKQALYNARKEELMREIGVIEFGIIKTLPTGIYPDSVVVPYDWAQHDAENKAAEKTEEVKK